MTVEMTDATTSDQGTRVSFLWLEITGKCQLASTAMPTAGPRAATAA